MCNETVREEKQLINVNESRSVKVKGNLRNNHLRYRLNAEWHFYCSLWPSELLDSVDRILIFFNNQQIILVIKKCLHRGRKRSDVSVEERPSCCVLCQDILKDPVSTSCGHWFCRQCITSNSDRFASPGDSCPQCGKRSRCRSTSTGRFGSQQLIITNGDDKDNNK